MPITAVDGFSRIARRLACVAVMGVALLAMLAPTPVASASDLARIEAYLNGLTTIRARFVQLSSDGGVAEGDLFMARPGRIRLEYHPPVPVLLVSDGTWLVYYDRKLQQVSHVLLSATPADILLREQIALEGDAVKVIDLTRDVGMIRLTLIRRAEPDAGSLTLVFDENPVRLRQWIVTDPQGIVTQVSLTDARFGVPLNPKIFEFRNPELFGPDANPPLSNGES